MTHLATAVSAGRNDFPHFVEGWHDRERDGRTGIAYRASKPVARFELARDPNATHLCILVSAPRGLCAADLQSTVSLHGAPELLITFQNDLWVLRRIPLPDSDGESPLSLQIKTPEAPCPDDLLHNGDGRRLGLFLGAAWQESCSQSSHSN